MCPAHVVAPALWLFGRCMWGTAPGGVFRCRECMWIKRSFEPLGCSELICGCTMCCRRLQDAAAVSSSSVRVSWGPLCAA
jgi:hypothetical protein